MLSGHYNNIIFLRSLKLPGFTTYFSIELLSLVLYCFISTFYTYSNRNYQNLCGKICKG